ncbi:MAG: YigZ family protein [Candidatus Marinimicrobia bacterium]|nr:YigZ family protein [Candidatus Neomarinimicrobiota bacterium]MDP6936184.1 YigZ family protein [Candidatus Neomarinimicrobiota bacterium]
MPDFYLSGISKGEYSEKGSLFSARAYPANTLDEVKAELTHLKENFPESSHYCYAYRIYHASRLDEFSTDAGEPKGSAGLPILNVLKRHELVNICIFVLRFYGGSKLGIPGLINAYGAAAEDAVTGGKKLPWIKTEKVTLHFNYVLQGKVEAVLKKFKAEIITSGFGESIKLQVEVNNQSKCGMLNSLREISNGKIEICN